MHEYDILAEAVRVAGQAGPLPDGSDGASSMDLLSAAQRLARLELLARTSGRRGLAVLAVLATAYLTGQTDVFEAFRGHDCPRCPFWPKCEDGIGHYQERREKRTGE